MDTLSKARLIVVKIGSSLLVDETTGKVNQTWLDHFSKDIEALTAQGKKITIVSSGAIALGRTRLNLGGDLTLPQKQACAAAGQALLTQAYETALAPYDIMTAQALLTLNDTENRRRWLNARETLDTLLSLNVVPVINENDTVATDEIRYGDNDRLAARVAQMVGADLLVLLSDIDGLYDKNPAAFKDAVHMPIVENLTPQILAMGAGANETRGTGTGGMATKLQAAKIATDAGCTMIISKGDETAPLTGLDSGKNRHTLFLATTNPAKARKQWISGSLKPKGSVEIDEGAAGALVNGKSLLAAGITGVTGEFEKGDAINIVNKNGTALAIGLTAYSANEAGLIKGLKSGDIGRALGYDAGPVVIHRDNMVMSS